MKDKTNICNNCGDPRHNSRVLKKITEYFCDNCPPEKFSTITIESYDPEFSAAIKQFCDNYG